MIYRQTKLNDIRTRIESAFDSYDNYGSVSAKREIRKLLNQTPALRKEYSWLEKELIKN